MSAFDWNTFVPPETLRTPPGKDLAQEVLGTAGASRPPAAPRFTTMDEIALFNAALGRTLSLRRTPSGVHVHLFAGRKEPGKEPLVVGFNQKYPPMVCGLDMPALDRQWLDVGFNAYALDTAEAHAIAIWLGQHVAPEAGA